MPGLVALLLALQMCFAQSEQSQSEQSKVEAVLRQLERAEQKGDFNAFVSLWSSEKGAELENLRSYARARPEVTYRATTTYVHGDRAVLLGQGPSQSFVTMTFRKEDGQWKIQDQAWRDTAPDPNSVYALLPPDPGAFTRRGSNWDGVGRALDPGRSARFGWNMKAVFDDAYLYIRLESNHDLPAPGSTIEQPPGGWPVLKIGVSGRGDFVLYDAVNVGDQATFDEHGRANSHRAFAAYSIRLERNGHEVFSTSADLFPSPLVEVTGRYYDIRIPLITMGVRDSRTTQISLGDAQWPNSAIVNVVVSRYAP